MSGRVVVVSSANHDVVVTAERIPRPGETVAGTTVTSLNGGKGANQAVAAARAGGRAVFVGAVGDDDAGRSAADDLDANGVDTTPLLRLPDVSTGTALVTVGADGENCIVVVPGANGRLGAGHVRDALGALELSAGDVCVLGFEVSDEVVVAAAETAYAAGARVALNPSPVREVPAAVWECRPMIIANEAEALAVTGAASVDQAAEVLHVRVPGPHVITLGGDGALVVGHDGAVVRVPTAEVTPVDTTGAGDTFAGVWVATLTTTDDLTYATRRAVAAAGLSVTVAGARASSPTAEAILASGLL